jgi:hypothetical protein
LGKVAGRCINCGRPSLRIYTCSLCGVQVCPACFDQPRSICLVCAKRRPSSQSKTEVVDDIKGPTH